MQWILSFVALLWLKRLLFNCCGKGKSNNEGGGQPSSLIFNPPFTRSFQMPPQVSTYFPPEQLVSVRLQVRGRTRPIKGPKTGVFYGRFKAGDEFQIHRDDYAAHPVWFQLVNKQTNQVVPPPPPHPAAAPPSTEPAERTPFDLTSVPGVGEATADVIQQRFAVKSAEDVAALTVDQLTSIPKVNAVLAENIMKAATDAINALAAG
jgi:hypothetical protein